MAPEAGSALRPGPIPLALCRGLLQGVFESDLVFALPFVVWGALYFGPYRNGTAGKLPPRIGTGSAPRKPPRAVA